MIHFLLLQAALAQTFTTVDVQSVPAEGDAKSAIVTVTAPANPREIRCDILIASASAGGAAAALEAARRGNSVCVTEETDSLGGQFHSVPALDEHKFIEISGATRSYHQFRNRIRDHYRRNFRLSEAAALWENLNPGSCYVSSLCYEPKVTEQILEEMFQAQAARIQLLKRTRIVHLERSADRIVSALAYNFLTREVVRIRPRFVLDATEMGDLLPLAKVPYAVGSEAKSETQEPHAAPAPNTACVQSFTYTFGVEHRDGEDHRIGKPDGYERIRDSQPFGLRVNYPREFGWRGEYTYSVFGDDAPVPNNMSPRPFFPWRRLLATRNFASGQVERDLVLMNWPRQDYHDESVLDRTPADTARILQAAKRVALSFLYWMQHDIPRDDAKGTGYPGMYLRKDVMGSADGLSKYPYIRESRRIKGAGRVAEQDLHIDSETESRARHYADSVGTGFYMVDIHPCGANERGRMMMPKPFQIPMSAMLPQGLVNFLPAAKSIGVTHLTNGAFRLHPIEWNIGESAAVIASLALSGGGLPEAGKVQTELAAIGVPLVWFDDVPTNHPAFSAIQLAAIRGLYPMDPRHLHGSPDSPLTRSEAAEALCVLHGVRLKGKAAADHAVKQGWMAVDHRNWFHGDLPFYWTDWRREHPPLRRTGPVTRAEFAARVAAR
ncbi:MAG: FAD-dependent oxidoreductase [Bryobacterales bacterium]|nr:FAD-dependent oxidoreductase [Bryobacterales bacterium]